MSSAYRKTETCWQHYAAQTGGMTYLKPARTTTRRTPGILVAGLLVVIAAIVAPLGYQLLAPSPSTVASLSDVMRGEHRGALGEALPNTVWPAYGQAAVQIGQSQVQAGPNQHSAAIASVAKVMTAYVVLRDHPLPPGQDGPTITLTDADVADTERRRGQQESVVSIAAGEQLTERQALQALLLPSANNIAAVLARWDAGSVDRFVARMNATARSLGMTHTRYTDPSGYDDATVSTAADQVRLVDLAMRLPVFARIVATPSATLPVAGTVRNTNALLGRNGFVGVKTGSTAAAGGCFAFRAIRWIDGKQTTITGVVLGQPGDDRVAAGLAAADAMVDRIAGQRAVPDLTQRTLPPRTAPRTLPPRTAPRSHRPRLPAHVRRPHARSKDAAVIPAAPDRHSEVAVQVAAGRDVPSLRRRRPVFAPEPSFMPRQAGSRRTARTLAPSP
jgi:serine-type D-Ala-D-Ala carboxypeptidase (penicillin-binding protein 5/6)